MKSSSNRFAAKGAVASWKPDEIVNPVAADVSTVSAEEVLALFMGDLPLRPPAGLRGPSDLRAKSVSPCPSWIPTDLPPFEMTSIGVKTAEIHMPLKKETLLASSLVSSEAASANQEQVDELFSEAKASRSAAEQMLEDAKVQAQKIIRQAQEEAELRLQQAYQQGRAQAEAQLASSIQASQAVIQELETWRDSMLTQSETVVIGMVQEIAQSLFGNGMVVDPKTLQVFLTKSMTHARNMGNLRIFVNPADAAHIEPDWREYQTAVTGQRMQIIPTDNIKPGGCYLEADMGSVDARIDTRMEAVMSVFNQNPV